MFISHLHIYRITNKAGFTLLRRAVSHSFKEYYRRVGIVLNGNFFLSLNTIIRVIDDLY